MGTFFVIEPEFVVSFSGSGLTCSLLGLWLGVLTDFHYACIRGSAIMPGNAQILLRVEQLLSALLEHHDDGSALVDLFVEWIKLSFVNADRYQSRTLVSVVGNLV